LHFAFNIKDPELKYKFINILIDEEVGDLNKPNIMGLLPHELEHTQPLTSIPEEIKSKIPWLRIEIEEADYLILCKQTKKDILIEQLI
jgi:hypothetical protein